jgi:hypothetical protein
LISLILHKSAFPEYNTAWHLVILSHEYISYLSHVGCTFFCICKNSSGPINYSFQTHEFKTTHQCCPDASWTPVTISPSLWFPVMGSSSCTESYQLFLIFPEGILPYILPQNIFLRKQLWAWPVPHSHFNLSESYNW